MILKQNSIKPKINHLSNLIIILISIVSLSCANKEKNGILKETWGKFDNKTVYLYTLTNANEMSIKVTNYGAIITSIIVPDRYGELDDVVLGFDNLEQYVQPNPCFGAAIGRFANRIRNARFTIDDQEYLLEKNDGDHCLHGANEFDKVVWRAKAQTKNNENSIRLHYTSPDGAKGFPGKLDVYVTYTLTDNNEVMVRFEAETNKATHVSLTQHSYFNLNGAKAPIYDHVIKIDADKYTAIDEYIIPTGELSSVSGTDWDLRQATRIGENIHKLDHNGYHFCYVFNKKEEELKKVIKVKDPSTGRTLSVASTQPGVQFYTGNAISRDLKGKYGIQYKPHSAFCLETQHLPDSPNHANFPSTLLRPGQKYEEQVIYTFGIIED